MKNYICTIIFCLPFFTFSQNKVRNSSVDVDITWDGRQCRGTNGICDISETSSNKASNYTATIDDTEGTITFVIDRSLLSVEEETKIISKSLGDLLNTDELLYALEYDFNFNLDDRELQIAAGNYPIILTEETITITFNLQ